MINKTYSKYHVCTTHTNNYEILESVILDNKKDIFKKYLDKNKIKEGFNKNITEKMYQGILYLK